MISSVKSIINPNLDQIKSFMDEEKVEIYFYDMILDLAKKKTLSLKEIYTRGEIIGKITSIKKMHRTIMCEITLSSNPEDLRNYTKLEDPRFYPKCGKIVHVPGKKSVMYLKENRLLVDHRKIAAISNYNVSQENLNLLLNPIISPELGLDTCTTNALVNIVADYHEGDFAKPTPAEPNPEPMLTQPKSRCNKKNMLYLSAIATLVSAVSISLLQAFK